VLSPSEPECTLPVQCTRQILKVPYVLLHCFPATLPLHPRNLQNTSSSKSPQTEIAIFRSSQSVQITQSQLRTHDQITSSLETIPAAVILLETEEYRMVEIQQPHEASPTIPSQFTTHVSPPTEPNPSPSEEYVEYQRQRMTEASTFILSQQRPAPCERELLSMMGQTLDSLRDHRTFSSLTTDDFEKLREGGERGDIFINDKTISNEMCDVNMSDDFWWELKAIRQVMSRVKETGVRHVIGHFSIHATLIAREMFNDERLIVHSECEVEETEIPPIGNYKARLTF